MTEVEYIQSTGTQYIDTGIIATSDISFEISFEDADLSGGDPMMIGYRPNTWNAGLAINNGGNTPTTNLMYLYFGGDGNAGRIPEMASGIVKLANGYREVDGVRSTFTPVTFTYHHPMYVFAANNVADGTSGGDTPFHNSKFKLRYLKIWNDETLVRDYIPVLDDSDVACLYDNISETFFYNLGSGAFIPGDPVVPPPPPPPPPPAGYFEVLIQRNNSENMHITKDTFTIAEMRGVLREDCSLTDPVILFEAPLTSFVDANYMTIPIFGRSYFIRDVNSIGAQLTEVYAHVDVLSSFADEIKANSGIIRRQANDWNLYLNDDVIRCYQNPIVETRLFPHGFENSSYVLLLAGRRNVGINTGQGGVISGDGIECGGAGNVNSKTTSGLVQYAAAQVGKPYWYGTFGNEASADLLRIKRDQYKESGMYDISVVGGEPFEDQYGQRVHDCVGLIKGYRWRENATGAEPVYRLAEDVNVQGLYAQCTRKKGTVGDPSGALIPAGAVLFYSNMQHCGVHIGAGSIIEARGHRYGVVITSLATRPDFTLWGIPDWLQQV